MRRKDTPPKRFVAFWLGRMELSFSPRSLRTCEKRDLICTGDPMWSPIFPMMAHAFGRPRRAARTIRSIFSHLATFAVLIKLPIALTLALLLLSAHPCTAAGQFASAAVPAQQAQQSGIAPSSTDAEQRVILKLRNLIRPGQPLVVSRLYNEVFTDPSERKVLDHLFNLFFKIPIYLVQEFESRGKPPSLQELSQQFHLVIPGEAQLLLTIMEADPRVPKFFRRDSASGEILSVDPAALRANPRFAAQLERSLTGLEGKAAPDFKLAEIDSSQLSLSSLRGRTVLLDFWFTNCPPCGQISAHLVTLQQKYGGDKFTVLGLNCDRILELPYTDADRAAYLSRHRLNFPTLRVDAATLKAYGEVSIFPTLFLIGPDGVVRKQFINYQSLATLEAALKAVSP